jgi:hypothetical protein
MLVYAKGYISTRFALCLHEDLALLCRDDSNYLVGYGLEAFLSTLQTNASIAIKYHYYGYAAPDHPSEVGESKHRLVKVCYFNIKR